MPQWARLPEALRETILLTALVLPFRVNRYVVERLIDWDRAPDDPIFQLTFPQPGMLADEDLARLRALREAAAPRQRIDAEVRRIREALNPQPDGQLTHNVPMLEGRPLEGVQHKYEQTVLLFPKPGQTCHAYCSYCFRWAQFVGDPERRFAASDSARLVRYLHRHPAVTDVLVTGGDPLVMRAEVLRRFIIPLLSVETVRTVRIGTKSTAYWPQRFVSDDDADELMRLFERIVASGRHLAVMSHASHPVELSTAVARAAIARIRATGAIVRMQAPLIRHVNDDAGTWATLWRTGVHLGMVPYYMFVERDTGPRGYFEVPLVRGWRLFRGAYRSVSGLARTVRGPVMSCHPGKCQVLGARNVGGERAFVLRFLQARDPQLVGRPFFARFDADATWFDDLEPLTTEDVPFFAGAAPAAPGRVALTVDGRACPNGSRSHPDED